MKLPAIVKPEQHEDVRVLVFCGGFDNNAIHLEGPLRGEQTPYELGDNLENVTAEYLANTYGEVESKEHAEFIVKLCKANDIPVICSYKTSSIKSFHNSCGCAGLYPWPIDKLVVNNMKQITIPLPPECESVDEWPRVGDIVTWGAKNINGEIKGIDDELAWIRNDLGNHNTVHIDELEKPKTPEQELRDEISDLAFNQFNDDSYDLTHNSYYLAEQLISKYDITKKPQ